LSPPKASPSPEPDANAPTPSSGGTGVADLFGRIFRSRESSVLIVLVLLLVILFFSPARDAFYGKENWLNLSRQIALLSIFAIGETVVIITGGIDLSQGSLIAFTGMLLAAMVTRFDTRMFTGAAIGMAILLTLIAALTIGGLHATLIHRIKLPPFVVTLASLTILRSQALLMNRQLPITLSDYPFLKDLANGSLFTGTKFPIPIPLVILIVVAIVVHLLLSQASIGRYIYSVGSNEQATRLSGVNVGRVKLFAYGTSALLGGIAGILYAGYGSQGDPLSAQGYELNAVAAAVIGGANLMGGQGTVSGTILGACLLNVILTGMNMIGVPNESLWEGTVVGGVLLLAVLTTALRQRRKE